MKRGILYGAACLIFCAAMAIMSPKIASAATVTDASGIEWNYVELPDGTVEIGLEDASNGLDNVIGRIAIPSTVDGYTVTRVKNDAFYYNSKLLTITIPDTVTKIGNYAFGGCESLTSVAWNPANITEVGNNAFSGCEKLSSIELPTNASYVTIKSSCFSGCAKLTAITIPGNVASIENSAFANSGLTSLTIPNTVLSLGSSVLYNCDSLTSVSLPVNEFITEIPTSFFEACDKLSKVTIPSGYTDIGERAFANSAITGIVLPDTIGTILDEAFYSCSKLCMVQFTSQNPPSFIGDYHFGSCDDNLQIFLPEGTATVYKATLIDADNTLRLPSGTTYVERNEEITAIPVLSGKISVTGTLYVNQPISTLKLSGTFLNAFTNTQISGTLTWDTPNLKYTTTDYVNQGWRWIFTPDAAYGTGVMKATGIYYFYGSPKVQGGSSTTTYTPAKVVVTPNKKVISNIFKPGKPTIKSVKKKGKKAAKVTWKKAISGASGYQIAVSTKKKKGYKVKKTINKQKTKSSTIKGLKKGKTYYIKVRAFTTVSGVRIYGSYSKIKKIKL